MQLHERLFPVSRFALVLAHAPRLALAVLGAHPNDGEPVLLLDGRYGPYVKHGKLNASLPKGMSPDDITMDQARELLTARAARGPRTQRGRRKK